MRSVTFSPPPPIQIGSRACTGFGSHCASVSVKNSPSKVVRSCVSRPRTHCTYSSSMRSRSPGRAVVHAVRVVLVLQPAAAEPEHDAAVRDLVERRHRVGEHRGVAVAGGVHERAARDVRSSTSRARRATVIASRQCGSPVRVGGVEVVPDRDPVEAERLDARPELAQLGDARVLQAGVHSEANVHRRGRYPPRTSAARFEGARSVARTLVTLRGCCPSSTGPSSPSRCMVVALTGWVDAGGAGRGRDGRARRAARRTRRPFGSIDVSELADLQQTRPIARWDDDARVIDWPRITFECGRIAGGREGAGRDVVLVRGPEPSLRWPTVASSDRRRGAPARRAPGRDARRHARARLAPQGRGRHRVGDAALARAGARRRCGPTTPARPGCRRSCCARSATPGSRGAGLWAQVPQYVSGSPSPPAIRALLAPARRGRTTSTSICARSTSAARRTCGASRPGSRPVPT